MTSSGEPAFNESDRSQHRRLDFNLISPKVEALKLNGSAMLFIVIPCYTMGYLFDEEYFGHSQDLLDICLGSDQQY